MTDLRIVSEPRGDAEDATFVRDGLALSNVAVTGDSYYSPLAIFLKDERGAVLGGALGHVWGGWLDLDTLWVAEPFRGQGYGAKLLRAAEDEARMQGCHGVFLTTFSFHSGARKYRSTYVVASRHETIFEGSQVEGALSRRRRQAQGRGREDLLGVDAHHKALAKEASR